MAEAEVESTELADAPKVSLIKKMIVPLVIAVAITGITLGALSFLGVISLAKPAEETATTVDAADEEGKGADGAVSAKAGTPAFFFSFYPDLLVNFQADGKAHYLKATIDVMSHDEEAIKGVEEYHSIMRNNLLKLFQQVEFQSVNGSEGMELMQAIALEEIKRVLKIYSGNTDIEGVYFTSFVVQ